jgi:hypothetical protein
MLNNVLWFYEQGQWAKLKRILQSENIVPNMYKYDATPRIYWQTLLL